MAGKVFVSYSHRDSARVLPVIEGLRAAGFEIWYDTELTPGVDWNEALAHAIEGCSVFLYFVSAASVASSVCEREVLLAVRRDRRVVPVYLEAVPLSATLELGIGHLQALYADSIDVERIAHGIEPLLRGARADGDDGPRRPAPRAAGRSSARARWIVAGAVVVLAGVAGLLVEDWLDAPVDPGRRIAVLAFENFTGHPANDYLGSGLAEELLDTLARLDALHVIPRTASFYYRDKDVPFTVIAEALDADVVLEGSVLAREGQRLRIATQLIDVESNAHIWSEIYDLDLDELIEVKALIADAVIAALGVAAAHADPIAAVSLDGDAYDLYLQGKDHLRNQVTREDQTRAEAAFLAALEAEPAFEPALAGLCETHLEMYVLSRDASDYQQGVRTCSRLMSRPKPSADGLLALGTLNRLSNNLDEALALYERVLAQDGDNEPALYGISRCYEARGDLAQAERYARRSVEAEPRYWKAHTGYAGFLYRQGRYAESAEQSRRVTELTPENPVGWGNLGASLFAADRWEEAETAWRRAFELDRTRHGYGNLATLYYYRHRFEDARALLTEAVAVYPDDYRLLGRLGAVLRQLDDPAASEEAYARAFRVTSAALAINPDDAILLGHHAYFAAALGEGAAARETIAHAKAVQGTNPEVYYLEAYVGALLGEADLAVEARDVALERGYSARQAQLDPMLATLVSPGRRAPGSTTMR